ncbi:MAG: hypothetical protein HN368_15220, partial [Spirochaetales bacterium]|nr:hypothetical protein [Spirochaetales bacterium]
MKYTKLFGPIIFLGLLIFTMSSTVFAIPLKTFEAFPENYETRIKHRELIFGSKNDIFSFESAVYPQNGDGANVSMQVLRQNESFYLLFTNQDGVDYPIYSRGSYIIKRNDASGAFEQIKIFVRSEPGSFVRILPDGGRSTMDVFLMDVPIFKNVILPITLEQLSVEPFSRIVEASRYQVDWTIITQRQQRQGDREIKGIVDTLRPLLASLRDSDDGALDTDGTFKFIDDLTQNLESGFNCSGFAKWVVDGLYLPRTGESLPIELLKVKHLDSRGNEWSRRYEDERDPYFGLDWSRN